MQTFSFDEASIGTGSKSKGSSSLNTHRDESSGSHPSFSSLDSDWKELDNHMYEILGTISEGDADAATLVSAECQISKRRVMIKKIVIDREDKYSLIKALREICILEFL